MVAYGSAILGSECGCGAPVMSDDGGRKPITGSPSIASRIDSSTACRGFGWLAAPAASCGLSGSDTNDDAASCGVKAENQAALLESVVPVLPAIGRPTKPYTSSA